MGGRVARRAAVHLGSVRGRPPLGAGCAERSNIMHLPYHALAVLNTICTWRTRPHPQIVAWSAAGRHDLLAQHVRYSLPPLPHGA